MLSLVGAAVDGVVAVVKWNFIALQFFKMFSYSPVQFRKRRRYAKEGEVGKRLNSVTSEIYGCFVWVYIFASTFLIRGAYLC